MEPELQIRLTQKDGKTSSENNDQWEGIDKDYDDAWEVLVKSWELSVSRSRTCI